MNEQPFNLLTLWDYTNPAASEQRFRAHLANIPASSELACELWSQIARAQGLQRQVEVAHRTLDGVVARLNPSYRRAQIRIALERGRLFNSAGNATTARGLFLSAWEQALAAEETFLAVDAAHMLAIIAPPEEQLSWHRRALNLAASSADEATRGWLGSLYNNLGWAYHELGDQTAALDCFEKALAHRQQLGQAVESRIAAWAVARILRAMGRTAEALARQQQLEAEWAASGAVDGYVFEEIGECLLSLGDYAGATLYFAKAYTELSQDPWLVDHEAQRLDRLRQLATDQPAK